MTSDPVPYGHSTAAFPVPNGTVKVSFPDDLSAADLLEVEAFLKVLLESLRRRANEEHASD